MKKAKLFLSLMLALALCLGIVAACGPKDEGDDGKKDDKIRVPVTALANGDFEEFDAAKVAANQDVGIPDNRIDTLAGWTFENKQAGVTWENGVAPEAGSDTKVRWVCDGNDGFNALAKVHNNGQALSLGEASPCDFDLKQTVTGLKAGDYELKVWVYTTGTLKDSLSIKQIGGEGKSQKSPKNDSWNQLIFKYTLAADGDLEIGLNFKDATGGKSAFVDDARLYQVLAEDATYEKPTMTAPTLTLTKETKTVNFNYVQFAEKYVVSYKYNGGTAVDTTLTIDRTTPKTAHFNSWTLDKDDLGSYEFTVKAVAAEGELINESPASAAVTLNIYEIKKINFPELSFQMSTGDDVSKYLPGTTEVTYDAEGDPTGIEAITWDTRSYNGTDPTVTAQTITGKVAGKFKSGVSNQVTAVVTKVVKEYVSGSTLEDWEAGLPSGWTVTVPEAAEYTETDVIRHRPDWSPADDNSGSLDFPKGGDGGDYAFTLSQDITGLTAGRKYTVSMFLNAGAYGTAENITVTVTLGTHTYTKVIDKDNQIAMKKWVAARDVEIVAGDIVDGKTAFSVKVEKKDNGATADFNTWFAIDNISIGDYAPSDEAELTSVKVMNKAVTLTADSGILKGSLNLPSTWVAKLAADSTNSYVNMVKTVVSDYATAVIAYSNNKITVTVTSEDRQNTTSAEITVNSLTDLLGDSFFDFAAYDSTTGKMGNWTVTKGADAAIQDAASWGDFLFGGIQPGSGTKFTYTIDVSNIEVGTVLKLDAGINFGGEESSVTLKVGGTTVTIDPTSANYQNGLGVYYLEHTVAADDEVAGSITVEISFGTIGWGAINHASLYAVPAAV